jgi:7-cyano-7-deazaguanine synthase in queuosine biosynthesis
MKKKILVVWSGGLDSTSVLLDALACGHEVETLYTSLENNGHKVDNELRRRKMMRSVLRLKEGKTFKDTVVNIPSLIPAENSICTFWQPTLWIWGLMLFLKKDHQFDEVRFGYIRGDDFWHVRDKVVKLFKVALEALGGTKDFPDDPDLKIPRLVYPFEWQEKIKLAEYMYKNNPEILQLIWTCENPENRTECGRCNTCQKRDKMYNELFRGAKEDER